MGPVAWLVAIGCLFLGAAVGVWGFTDVNKSVAIWFVGFPGAILLIIALGLEFQSIAKNSVGGLETKRAAVSVDGLVIEPWGDDRGNLIGVRIMADWKNSGAVAAIKAHAAIFYTAYIPTTKIDDVPDEYTSGDDGSPTIPVGGTMRSTAVRMPLAHLAQIRNGQIKGFLFLRMRYNDFPAGTEQHETEWSGEIEVTENPDIILQRQPNALPNIIKLRIIGKRNRAT